MKKEEKQILLSDLGNIYSSNGDFTAQAAILQSYYRISQNEPCGLTRTIIVTGYDANGKTIRKSVPKLYGHILQNGLEQNKNFFFVETFEYAHHRVKFKTKDETIRVDRLFNNLLSSMPLAFNLFHPLMMMMEKHSDELTKMIQNVFPELPVSNINKIRIEFVPAPIQNYTNNKSAMDAAIEFSEKDGSSYIISIETKYTDELGQNKASDNLTLLAIAKELNMFTEAGINKIAQGCTQIYRNFLSTEKYAAVHNLKDSHSIILAPENHPTTEKEMNSLLQVLKPEYHYKLKKYSLENFVKSLELNCPESFRLWLDWFYDRYLNFTKTEHLYQQFKQQ